MSEEQLKAFLEKVKSDSSLQEKLKSAADAGAVVEIAKDAGLSISAEDLTTLQVELSEKELEGVGGGTITAYAGYNGANCGGWAQALEDKVQRGTYDAATAIEGLFK